MSADLQPKVAQGEDSILPRFQLWVLFYVTTVIAAAVALFGGFGILWAAAVLGFWLARIRRINNAPELPKETLESRSNPQSGYTWVELLVVIAIIMIVIGMFLPAVGRGRYGYVVHSRMSHQNAMRQVCLALHNYVSANGHFPPAYIADENGKPMHSWRVLLLPYLEEEAIFDQYDFDEPWNGPNNSKLAEQIRDGSFSGFWSDRPNSLTGFKLVTGPETAFVNDSTKDFSAIAAGSSNTICLVDDNSNPVNWMAPEDVTIDEAVKLFDQNNKSACASVVIESKFRKETFYFSNVGMFDASAQRAGFLNEPSKIREHFTISTPPETPLDDLEFDYPIPKIEKKPDGYILVMINLGLALLPLFWIREKAA